ncbi:MAG TPA: ATP-dependent DNA ligase [Oceanithermus profundus]|uniref:Probable DNA ligase n=1 Tax=Oceanithermus profundus TaxID=187137 RepID=A0A7C4Z667_9DEIN|nr:ATP-dependent DNA ligase [Oceanithermus profundus]
MTFRRFVATLEEVERASARLAMVKMLAEAFRELPPEEVPLAVNLLQGRVAPEFEGLEFGVAEKEAAKALAIALGRDEAEVVQAVKEKGDIGAYARETLPERAGGLNLKRVYEELRAVAEDAGPGSQARKRERLARLVAEASPEEAAVILRIVTGRLRLGVGDATVLEALALAFLGDRGKKPLLERAYNLTSDLAYVARLALEGEAALQAVRLEVGKPVRMMLAERLPGPAQIMEKLGPHYAEHKYDGERVQVHFDGARFWVYSRRLENITHQYPDLLEALSATQKRPFIIEAEAVVVDPLTGEMRPFQNVLNRKVKHLTPELLEKYPIKGFVFEILYADGEVLIERPYRERRERLERWFRPHERLELSVKHWIESVQDLTDFFDAAIEAGCEGLVCKKADGDYEAGKRGFKWVKYKRGIAGKLSDTLDLVIVGAWLGRGRRAGSYGSLLAATYDPDADRFETLTKVGSGFSDEDLNEVLPRRLDPYRREERHPRVWSLLEPDVWFDPVQVIEVEAQEITLSPNHTCAFGQVQEGRGLALRFPRFVRYRDDKSPEEATTSSEVVEMYRNQWAG